MLKSLSLLVAQLLIIALLIFQIACTESSESTAEPFEPTGPVSDQDIISQYLDLDLEAPSNFANPSFPVHYDAGVQATDNASSVNQVTDEGAALGRVLFYDTQLSINKTISCASCHDQSMGFSDENTLSMGFEGGLTGAHSMRLANANFYEGDRMFWDKRALDLEDQSTQPIKDHVEMGFDETVGGIDSLINRMNQLEYYPILFTEAFGSTTISESRIQMALAQFIRSMVSVDSKFDQGAAQVYNPNRPLNGATMDFPNFTEQENLGKQLYILPPDLGGLGCQGCHGAPTFTLAENSRNNGLDADETTIFKSPSLKNIAVTGPYMHDGRLETLEAVVEHYNSGIQGGPTLDNRLRIPGTQQPIRLDLSEEEKQALVAFLHTLTDESLLEDEKFGDPFID